MQELTKIVTRQDANYKLSPSTSNETSINLSNEISAFISDESGNVTFKLYKDDFVKAVSSLCLLPRLYKKKETDPSSPYEILSSLYNEIKIQFGDSLTSRYTVNIFKRDDGRAYFNNLKSFNGFNIRSFLVEQFSILHFIKNKKGELTLRLETLLAEDNIERIQPEETVDSIEPLPPRQVIFYGAPGTGKSHKIKNIVKKGNHVRTTFHPDSDYASFVGAYKPTMEVKHTRDVTGRVIQENGKPVIEKRIVYDFVAQSFLQAYTEAWKRFAGIMTDKEGKNIELPENMDTNYFLVIEEINRGNCAQIFGDLFQLLDRDDNGESSYAIRPDQDIKRYLSDTFAEIDGLPEEIKSGEEMKLPSNLYIYATMNTSDQSLFPIDSAFKRRWDWEYVPIRDERKGYKIKVGYAAYSWSNFISKINEIIQRVTQSDDKQMGYWFVHLPEDEKEITIDKFVGKVLFYLWNDVFKDFGDGGDTIFIGKRENGEEYELRFKDFFDSERELHIHNLMRKNGIEIAETSDDIPLALEGEDDGEQKTNPDGSHTAIGKAHLNFWSEFKSRINTRGKVQANQQPSAANWFNIPAGLTGVYYCFKHNIQKGFVTAEIWIEKMADPAFYSFLKTKKAEIEAQLNWVPTWRNSGSATPTYMIGNEQSNYFDMNSQEGIENALAWSIEKGEDLYRVLSPIIAEFKRTH